MKPRQRIAIKHPCVGGARYNNQRFYRRIGYVQTMLTFDLMTDEEGNDIGVWHVRASSWPELRLSSWPDAALEHAERTMGRLLSGVGEGELDLKPDPRDPPRQIHLFRKATKRETVRARRNADEAKKREAEARAARGGVYIDGRSTGRARRAEASAGTEGEASGEASGEAGSEASAEAQEQEGGR